MIAAVSVGIYKGNLVLDLDYAEDSSVDTDMNIIMTEDGNFVEIQGTAEQGTFTQHELNALLDLAKTGFTQLFAKQREVLKNN
ncbi:MAG: hypothetical protein ACD_21C00241G0004 [uncultured bacterium]|nr:MAG: hypothetical protein ACD_21C00241G0004 [uncultured bacterium]